MYAIVDIAGQQIKVEKGQEVFVNRLEGKEGSKVNFEDVLLIDNNGKVSVGKPNVKGASVSAKIISHDKGDKVLVFHKKRRKGYQKLNGHRQYLSKIVIEGISEKAAKAKKTEPKAEPKKAAKPKTETKAKVAAKPKATTIKATVTKKVAKPKTETKVKATVKPKTTTTKATVTKKAKPKAEKK